MDHPNPQAAHEAIKEALVGGKKILAIKLYREMNKVGLAEAKAAVERMEVELGIAAVRGTSPHPLAGCLILLFVIAAVGIAIWKALAWWHGQPEH